MSDLISLPSEDENTSPSDGKETSSKSTNLLPAVIDGLSKLNPFSRFGWKRETKTTKLILRVEMDSFQPCQPKEIRRTRPLWLSDDVSVCHLRHDGKFTEKGLFQKPKPRKKKPRKK